MKYYIIAGEASGDLHGSRLIRSIRNNDPHAQIRAWGGDLMSHEGANIVKHYRDLAFMGFIEVIMNLRTILKNMDWCKKDLLDFNPDVLILIDYPGFNLPIAKFAKSRGLKTAYYISPQVWAWKEGRVKLIKAVVDEMMVILPFEKDFYAERGFPVNYVGHPLVEIIHEHRASQNVAALKKAMGLDEGKTVVALLPGSRKQEILKKLPIMLATTERHPNVEFALAQAPGISDDFMQQFTRNHPQIKLVKNSTYDLLSVADAALVTSGTATLETALFGVPEVVCYYGSPLTYLIAKRLVKVPFISLVNLIMGRLVVKELIQHDLTADNLSLELNKILDPEVRKKMREDYQELWQKLEAGGKASVQAADIIQRMLR